MITIEQPSSDRREAALYYRDVLGWDVLPLYGPSEGAPAQRGKRPRFAGYRVWKCEQLTDAIVNEHFGSGKTSNIGIILRSPHVVVDLDSKHDEGKSAREWLNGQPHLAKVPRERTGGGYHLHFRCPDLPNFEKRAGTPYKKALGATITARVSAELFFNGLNVVLSPSVHKSGATYEWEIVGDVPEVTWLQLQEWFGFKTPNDQNTSNRKKGTHTWWKRFTGDIATLDMVALAKELNLYGRLLSADERKHSVRCPWSGEHADQEQQWSPADTSCVVFEGNESFPGFNCFHQQHGPKTLDDFLTWAEVQQPGCIEKHCKQSRCFGLGQRNQHGIPRIELPRRGRPAGEFATELGAIIQPHRKWFVRDDRVVEPRVAEFADDLTFLGFAELRPAEVCTAIEDFAETGRVVFEEESLSSVFQPTTMPESTGRLLLDAPQLKRSLDRISRVCEVQLPAIVDGKLTCTRLGYDGRFRTFTRTTAPSLSRTSLTEAKTIVAQSLLGFPWKAPQDLSHAVARLLTPFCRGLMGFSARFPLWFFEANRPRAGKDYLNGVSQIVYFGYAFEDSRLNSDPEEVRKRITTALIYGRTAMHFANCRGKIDQTALEQAVTAKVLTDRRLGSNDEVQMANEIEFSLSANVGLRFTPDFEPRTRKIRLAYPEEDANSRVFPNPNLHGWVLANRARVLSALAALVRNWYDNGMPPGPTPFTSFPEWGRVVGGILTTAGFGDPCLPHSEDGSTGDDLTAAVRTLFTVAYAKHPDEWIEKQQIYELIDENRDNESLGYFGDLSERSEQTRLGRALIAFVDRVLNEILLQRRDSGTSGRTDRASYRFTKPGTMPRDRGAEIHTALFGASSQHNANIGDNGDLAGSKNGDGSSLEATRTDEITPLRLDNGTMTRQSRQGSLATATYQVITHQASLAEIASAVCAASTVAFDIETYGESLDPWRGDIRILSLAVPNAPAWLIDLKQVGYDLGELKSALESVELIGHNAKFDVLWLAVKCGVNISKLYCTCTASRLLTAGSAKDNGLESCVARYLDISLSKSEGRSDWGSMLLTDDQLRYCANDVHYLHDLRAQLERQLRDAKLQHVAEMEMALLPVVVQIELTGFAIDKVRLKQLCDDARSEVAAATSELHKVIGYPVNPASPAQLLAAMRKRGLKLSSTGEDALAKSDDSEVVPIIRRYRGAEKRQQGTQKLLGAVQRDDRIHGQFNPTGTDTGRFSSKEPNMQNIERGDVRECFVAGPGNVLIVADYSQIELRVAAAIAPEPAMIAAYNAGADLHVQTARIVLKKSGDAISNEERRLAKAINFGLLYGQSAKGLVRYLKSGFSITISEAEAKQFIARFFAAYSGLNVWQQKCKRLANNFAAHEIRTAFGRRRLLARGKTKFWQRYTCALNMPIQGGCNDGLKNAMLRLSTVLPNHTRIISTIHDELVIETPLAEADAVKPVIEREMVSAMVKLYSTVPIEVEAKICRTWGD